MKKLVATVVAGLLAGGAVGCLAGCGGVSLSQGNVSVSKITSLQDSSLEFCNAVISSNEAKEAFLQDYPSYAEALKNTKIAENQSLVVTYVYNFYYDKNTFQSIDYKEQVLSVDFKTEDSGAERQKEPRTVYLFTTEKLEKVTLGQINVFNAKNHEYDGAENSGTEVPFAYYTAEGDLNDTKDNVSKRQIKDVTVINGDYFSLPDSIKMIGSDTGLKEFLKEHSYYVDTLKGYSIAEGESVLVIPIVRTHAGVEGFTVRALYEANESLYIKVDHQCPAGGDDIMTGVTLLVKTADLGERSSCNATITNLRSGKYESVNYHIEQYR